MTRPPDCPNTDLPGHASSPEKPASARVVKRSQASPLRPGRPHEIAAGPFSDAERAGATILQFRTAQQSAQGSNVLDRIIEQIELFPDELEALAGHFGVPVTRLFEGFAE